LAPLDRLEVLRHLQFVERVLNRVVGKAALEDVRVAELGLVRQYFVHFGVDGQFLVVHDV